MPQKQCPWCHKLGPRVEERERRLPENDPHANGSACVCRHSPRCPGGCRVQGDFLVADVDDTELGDDES